MFQTNKLSIIHYLTATMAFRFLLSSLIAFLLSLELVFSQCSVCGEGKEVTIPNGIFSYPGQQSVACGQLQDYATSGALDEFCEVFPDLITDSCGCAPKEELSSCSSLPSDSSCSICGGGKRVGARTAIFQYPNQQAVACGTLEDIGIEGSLLQEKYCSVLPRLVADICQCYECENQETTAPPTTLPSTEPNAPSSIGSCFPNMDILDSACSICGPGQRVGNYNAIFAFPNQQPIKCGALQDIGLGGFIITERQCPFLPPLVADICECEACNDEPGEYDDNSSSVPTAAPSKKPNTFAPSLPNDSSETFNCPIRVSDSSCLICGNGKRVGNPNAIFSFPNQQPVTCGTLEDLGIGGAIITESQCPFLPQLVQDICDCQVCSEEEPALNLCPTIPYTGCSVCGDGKTVTNQDAIFSFPGQPSVNCGILEAEGSRGTIPFPDCPLLPDLVMDTCGCETCLRLCPIIPDTGCSVCGEGKIVTNHDAIFSFPGQPSVKCDVLEAGGVGGAIPLRECPFLPGLVKDVCECEACETITTFTDNTSAPTTATPSFVPTDIPTNIPSSTPSFAPSLEPTASPSLAPTVIPTVLPSSVPSFSPTTPEPTFLPTSEPTTAPTTQLYATLNGKKNERKQRKNQKHKGGEKRRRRG